MIAQLTLLFCENPLAKNEVDPDYLEEYRAAKALGFDILLFSFDALIGEEGADNATQNIKPALTWQSLVYRGWMLNLAQYEVLYRCLLAKHYQMINPVNAYRNCHYLPDSLQFIQDYSPLTVFEPFGHEYSKSNIVEKAKVFGSGPVIIKDYVKSEKHDWDTACFVPDASDTTKLVQTLDNLVRLRGKYLNEGIVIRAYIPLVGLTVHSRSGMPLTEEYRLFFYKKKLIGIYDYWEEGDYTAAPPDTRKFELIGSKVESNFFTMDIARQKNGDLIIIELGDGQVSGLPDKADRMFFYRKLREADTYPDHFEE